MSEVMATVKWQASRYHPEIERVVIERETSKCVCVKWGKGRACRQLKDDLNSFFDTFEDAKHYLVESYLGRIESAKRLVTYYEKQLQQAQALTEPTDEAHTKED